MFWSHGQTATKPFPVGSATVTVSSAASAVFGTPERPATRSAMVPCEGRAPDPTSTSSRVSSSRVGDCSFRRPAPVDHPKLSTTSCTSCERLEAHVARRQADEGEVGDDLTREKLTVDALVGWPQG